MGSETVPVMPVAAAGSPVRVGLMAVNNFEFHGCLLNGFRQLGHGH
jgi:hypothetical protein